MENELYIFENKEFGKIRALEIDGAPWFVGKDVSEALGYKNTRDAISKHVDAEDAMILQRSQNATFEIPPRGLTIVNESGLYSLILSSKLPDAKRFKRWITSEVLPSIRKHGAYMLDAALEMAAKSEAQAKTLFAKLQSEKRKTITLMDKIGELAPGASYCELVLQSKNAVPVSLIAKDYGMSAVRFNAILHGLRIQYKVGSAWVPYQQYAGKGYTKSRTYVIDETTSAVHTYWTQKGRFFLYETLKACGILPLPQKTRDERRVSYNGGF